MAVAWRERQQISDIDVVRNSSVVASLVFVIWSGRVFPLWTVVCRTATSALVAIFVVLVLLYQRRLTVCGFVDDEIIGPLFQRLQFGFDGPNGELFAHFRGIRRTGSEHRYLNFGFRFLHFILRIPETIAFEMGIGNWIDWWCSRIWYFWPSARQYSWIQLMCRAVYAEPPKRPHSVSNKNKIANVMRSWAKFTRVLLSLTSLYVTNA